MKPVAILCNGNSLKDHADLGNLDKIPCETIGLNRSWEVYQSDYQVMVDPPQWAWFREIRGVDAGEAIPNLVTSKEGPGKIKLKILGRNDNDLVRWSWDPYNIGVWLCGSVTWVALQFAVALKKNPIFFLGLDLQGRGEKGKFWGGNWPDNAEARQRELFGYAAGMLGTSGYDLINVVIKPEDSKCESFPKKTFDESFERIEKPIKGDGMCYIGNKVRI